MEIQEFLIQTCQSIENLQWSDWHSLHEPTLGRHKGFYYYNGTAVYQLRNIKTTENVLVGIGIDCNKRMKSLYPPPYGLKRDNTDKVEYVYSNWRDIQFRILPIDNILKAKFIEAALLAMENHLFNT